MVVPCSRGLRPVAPVQIVPYYAMGIIKVIVLRCSLCAAETRLEKTAVRADVPSYVRKPTMD